MTRTLLEYIEQVEFEESSNTIETGDEFVLELAEDAALETTVISSWDDAVLLEADAGALEFLEYHGYELLDEDTIKVPVTQKPRQGPLRPQTGGGAHRDKKKEQKQGKEKHRKPFAEGFNTDVEMELYQLTKADNMFDAIYDALSRGDELGKHLQDMYTDVARERRLHPDDDFEDIISNMADQIEDSYGDPDLDEAKYRGRNVPLGKRMPGDVKKSKVYVRKPNGNIVKVNFGDKKMRIKKSNPKRRKSFRARHNCANPGPRWKARYWSCRAW